MEAPFITPEEFAAIARGFCDWCEGVGAPVSDVAAAYWLGYLYSNAARLPEARPENDEGPPKLPSSALAKAKATLAPFWGRHYRKYFDPAPELSEEPVVGDLGDDLLDTYQDIRAGLVLYEAGKENEALWHWSFLHRMHWGQHAAGALYALHCLSLSRT